MADGYSLYLRVVPPVKLIDLITDLLAAEFPDNMVTMSIRSNIPGKRWSSDSTGGEMKAALADARSFYEQRAFASITQLTVTLKLVEKPGHPGHPSFQYELGQMAGAAIFDLANINAADIALRIVDALHERFELTEAPALLASSLPEPMRSAIAFQEQSLSSLSTQIARLAEFTSKQIERNSEHVTEITQDLQKQFQEKEATLEGIYQKKQTTLVDREEELKAREAEFDLRANTAVRRDLLKEMRKILKEHESLELSPHTQNKRVPIHVLCIVAMMAGVVLAGVSFWELFVVVKDFDYRLLFPLSGGVLLFASTLIYYIRWNDHWFKAHADAEIANRKLLSDFLRASWIAELVMESEGESKIPESLIDAFSEELFRTAPGAAVDHPVDTVEHLFRRLRRIKIRPDELELERDPVKK